MLVKSIAIFFQGRKEDTSRAARELVPILEMQGYDVRSIDTQARPIRYAGTVPSPVLADVRAKLAAIMGM